ncbi:MULTISPECIES: alkaline phosphatase family protein [Micrococcaceae]|uniref:alkaline phosphatase family protein n=1 Tax=unclassified Kocuria TaxID=2649579 RepID=UPI001010483B|nr:MULTISPECIES: nucleotide pyrophosphatase/phosphodiesterase family protein [unclassified Kocuria]
MSCKNPRKDLTGQAFPAPPRYGEASIADLMTSAASLYRPVAESERSTEFPDSLDLGERLAANGKGRGPYRNVCVVLVDGLGSSLLSRHGGHAPHLRKSLDLGELDSALPSTTAASLAVLGTGMPTGQTGMVGYDVVDPDRGVVVNQLSGWDPAVDPLHWQPNPTIFERIDGLGDAVTVSMSAYEDSALTRAALRGSRFVAAGSTLARVSQAADILKTRNPTFMYLYWGELDQTGHKHGCTSERWLEALEELDHGLKRLSSRVGPDTLILLTADHGMVDVPEADRVDYSNIPELVAGVRLTAGEPRMVQLHLEDPDDAAVRRRLVEAWAHHFGDRAWILDREELISAGYFGDRIRPEVRHRIGDIIVAAHGSLALYDVRRTNTGALKMVGQHGSWTEEERSVPLRAWVGAGS